MSLMDAAGLRVAAVTVTYGTRFDLVRQVIEGALANGVETVVVVENGLQPESAAQLRALHAELPDRVQVVWAGRNTGSAGGFRRGLEAAVHRTDSDYLWLLDDDNVPQPGALEALQRVLAAQPAPISPLLALHSLRPDHLERLNAGLPFEATQPRPSSFFEFHLLDIPARLLLRASRRRGAAQATADPGTGAEYLLPYAAYGGLLLGRRTVDLIGYPDERFFVYTDDTEYTHRLTRAGGRIVLVPDSVLEDIDAYWGAEMPGIGFFTRLLFSPSPFRAYYTIRNHAYFDRHIWRRHPLMYRLNRALFLGILQVFAWRYRRTAEYRLVRLAVREGEAGQLGQREELPAP